MWTFAASLRPRRRVLFLAAWTLVALPAMANTATEPVPRDARWLARHEGFVAQAQAGGIDVLFLGDSITDHWRDTGAEVWESEMAPRHAANFGISADRTQHLLWRITHGELDGLAPRVVVVLIGTNNTGRERDRDVPRNTTIEAVEGVAAVVHELRGRLPSTRILLLALFPRGTPDDPQRAQVAEVNTRLAALHDGRWVHFVDIGDRFLGADGSIPPEVMPDGLHPAAAGYRLWAEAMRAPLDRLLAADAPP